MKLALLLVLSFILNSCNDPEVQKPKEIHLYMCELACLEHKDKNFHPSCKFKEGKCYFQQGCIAASWRKHNSIEDAIWISHTDCFLYKR